MTGHKKANRYGVVCVLQKTNWGKI